MIGLFVYCLIVSAIVVLIVKSGALRTKTGQEADKRLSVLEELLSAMQIVKMYCWESLFLQRLVDRRKTEVALYKLQARLLAVSQSFTFLSSHVLIILIYAVALYMKDTKDLFTTSSVFLTVMLSSFIMTLIKTVQMGLYGLSTMVKATIRIQNALLLPESENYTSNEVVSTGVAKLEFSDYVCGYPSDNQKPALQDLNFTLNKGQTLGVIGPVGCGKTTLLNCLIDETNSISGSMKAPSSISVTIQEPWIFGGSIQQNILMHHKMDEKRYSEVVNAACLVTDLEDLEDGDQTIVGAKGVTLSGEQRARVSLARCLYSDAELYILDDPLAAVDPNVANHIFEEAVKKYLKDKMVILITHQHQFLVSADKILYIEDGKQVFYGSYEEIMSLETKFIESLLTKNDQQDSKAVSKVSKIQAMETKEQKDEQTSVGLIKWSSMMLYMKSGSSLLFLVLYLLWKLCVHGGIVFYEIQLGIFATTSGRNICHENSVNQTCPDKVHEFDNTYDRFQWYSISYAVVFLLEVAASFFFFELVVAANKNLHNLALLGVLKSPMRFFNTNSVGRILNRFSQDLGRADNLLPLTANDTIFILFNLFGALVLAVYINWFNVLLVLPLGVYLIWLRQYYARTGREVKRLDSMAKSPIYIVHALKILFCKMFNFNPFRPKMSREVTSAKRIVNANGARVDEEMAHVDADGAASRQ